MLVVCVCVCVCVCVWWGGSYVSCVGGWVVPSHAHAATQPTPQNPKPTPQNPKPSPLHAHAGLCPHASPACAAAW